jgi:hypothetical protein
VPRSDLGSFSYVLQGSGALVAVAAISCLLRLVRGSAATPQTTPVTLGPERRAMFTTPAFDLPKNFAVIRWGARGHVLTLSPTMSGTVKIGRKEMSVAEFVEHGGAERAEGSAGPFRATPIGPGDWGVIELDRNGDHKLFFTYCTAAAALPRRSRRRDELLWPAIAFAIVLHAVVLAVVFTLHDGRPHSYMFPGTDEFVNDYLIERPARLAALTADSVKPGTEAGQVKTPPASTAEPSSAGGGKGDKQRSRAPDPDDGARDQIVIEKVRQHGLLRHSQALEKVAERRGLDKRLGMAMARLQGTANLGGPGGFGRGTGTEVSDAVGTGMTRGGTGKGPGGGGTAQADVVTGVSNGKGLKETAVVLAVGPPSGELGDLTAKQINKVVMARKNAIRACYARQLQRNPQLAGKIIIRWEIDSAGLVEQAKVKSTTMRNGSVEDCIVRQIQNLKLPRPRVGKRAVVNYPFVFSQR